MYMTYQIAFDLRSRGGINQVCYY